MSTPSVADPGPNSNRRWDLSSFVVAIVLGVIGSLLAAALGAVLTLFYQRLQETSITLDSPNGSNSVNSHPAISGHVYNLQPGYVVWSYDQPAGSNTAYPDAGPCRIEGDQYHCLLTNLSIDPTHEKAGSQDFRLWVTVVDTSQAALNIERKERLNNQSPFENIDRNGPRTLRG
jgi:hypothetical protein